MPEILKNRKKTFYLYNEENDLIEEAEEYWDIGNPEAAPEFVGVVGTLSLSHGFIPPEPVDQWSIYKIYEKCVIWMRHGAKGAS